MKHLIALVALAIGAAAHAHPGIDNMARECRAVMALGLCRVQNQQPLPLEMRSVPMRIGFGLGTVTTGAFMDVQEAGDGMCDLIEPACTAEWDGERCRVIRSLWRQ